MRGLPPPILDFIHQDRYCHERTSSSIIHLIDTVMRGLPQCSIIHLIDTVMRGLPQCSIIYLIDAVMRGLPPPSSI
ncbi:hypothetical protein DPMN_046414 [Dreissena polymorpha]|uniref:Uncharacterized protein n=1 Tax=Dreissena polymorpha TaxID=45954 RepID=A0A9D4D6Q6_DREPO|nr:hypothetical protein DPMN_046414 [Dreissena polymorpha]